MEILKLFDKKRMLEYLNVKTTGGLTDFRPLFRARVAENVTEHAELFHSPFENRKSIPTGRYSIPGFPCLYLSSSIHCCWLELERPSYNNFYVSRFESEHTLKILDLAKIPNEIDSNIFDLEKYLVTYPIIFACSIKVKEKNRVFKSEYIIPQLLLQATRQIEVIDGIRFYSTNKKIIQSNPLFFNYVFPAKQEITVTINNKSYSKYLIDNFRLTPPINASLFSELNTIGKHQVEAEGINRANGFNPLRKYYCERLFFAL